MSWAFSSAVSAVVANLWISALQTATTAWFDRLGVVAVALVELDVLAVFVLLLVAVLVLVLVEVLVVGVPLVVVGVLLVVVGVLLVVVGVLLVVVGVLLVVVLVATAALLFVVVVVVAELLPPHAPTSTPLTTAPIRSRYSLRVIDHPLRACWDARGI